jgi:ribonuclease P protein subunit RPR2
MPDMRGATARRGRRGRRTAAMIRVAHERIGALFSLAENEARRGPSPFPNRYVGLARRIGMRYNVRLPSELREYYCRRCSAHWIEGRTVRTRLRSGRRVRTCLVCGSVRRVPVRARRVPRGDAETFGRRTANDAEPALVDPEAGGEDWGEGEEE